MLINIRRALTVIVSVCNFLHRGFQRCLQRELAVLSVYENPRPVCVDGRSKWSESYPHWFLCS